MSEGPVNKYGRTKLIQNSGPVEIEMIGTLRRVKDGRYTKYYYNVSNWEFRPIEDDCW